MDKRYQVLAAAVLCVFLWSCADKAAPSGADTPERIFNTATEAMVKGDDAAAIELYYQITEGYPNFKKEYRADALFRLGKMLYRAERYEEAEKNLETLIAKHKNYSGLKQAYEMLLQINISVTKNSAKAAALKAEYKKLFGDYEKIKAIDRTIGILQEKPFTRGTYSEVLSLEVKDIEASSVKETADYDPEFFPVVNFKGNSALSSDKKHSVSRKKYNKKYYLFIKDSASNKERRLKGTLNAASPAWSWDGAKLTYTVSVPEKRERAVFAYDIGKEKAVQLFSASGVGVLTAVSPDGSKVAFTYRQRVWLVSVKTLSVGLISDKTLPKPADRLAWSRDGSMILSGFADGKNMIYTLGRREFVITK